MLNKNGSSKQYHLKFGINQPIPSDKEVQEFLDEMRRRANDKGIVISEFEQECLVEVDPNQMSLFE